MSRQYNIYLAGPMSGIEQFNFPAFDAAAARLRERGHIVFNPTENDRKLMGKGPDWIPEESDSIGSWAGWATWVPPLRQMLGDDMAYICNEADAIAMLPGWEYSKGARAEHALAVALGHKVIYLQDLMSFS